MTEVNDGTRKNAISIYKIVTEMSTDQNTQLALLTSALVIVAVDSNKPLEIVLAAIRNCYEAADEQFREKGLKT